MTPTLRYLLVLQHDAGEGVGTFAQFARTHELSIQTCRLDRGERLPSQPQAAGLIVMGGPMNVDDVERYPWLAEETAFIRRALDDGCPVLGICLGSQLMAKALGSPVPHGPAPEIGWFPITLTGAGRQHPFFHGLPSDLGVFHWHGDTFDLPRNAVHLASSERYVHQAFAVGRHGLALQFHLEVTAEMIAAWCAAASGTLRHTPGINLEALQAGLPTRLEALHHAAQTVFENWLRVAGVSPGAPRQKSLDRSLHQDYADPTTWM